MKKDKKEERRRHDTKGKQKKRKDSKKKKWETDTWDSKQGKKKEKKKNERRWKREGIWLGFKRASKPLKYLRSSITEGNRIEYNYIVLSYSVLYSGLEFAYIPSSAVGVSSEHKHTSKHAF